MLRIAFIIAALGTVSHQTVTRRADNQNLDPLKFKSDGSFQISVFSDLHFGEGSFPRGQFIDDLQG